MGLKLLTLAVLLAGALSLNCEQGSVANSLSICIEPRYIEGCHLYKTETSCKVCDYRYVLLEDGLCEFDKDTTEECCASRAGDGSCLKCKQGLYMVNGKCQESNIVGCLEKDSLGQCLNCGSDFFLSGGVCQQSIKKCVKFTDSSRETCTECGRGHSLYNNICVENQILGCKNEQDHVCRDCYKPFLLREGNCEIQHCKVYNDYKCVACKCGNFLTSAGICRDMQTGCVRYQRGLCTDCLPNFRLKGTRCEIQGCQQLSQLKCTRCEETYSLIGFSCELKNCSSWKDGSCEICKMGFNLKKGGCVVNLLTNNE